jgi:hypothetical protein
VLSFKGDWIRGGLSLSKGIGTIILKVVGSRVNRGAEISISKGTGININKGAGIEGMGVGVPSNGEIILKIRLVLLVRD